MGSRHARSTLVGYTDGSDDIRRLCSLGSLSTEADFFYRLTWRGFHLRAFGPSIHGARARLFRAALISTRRAFQPLARVVARQHREMRLKLAELGGSLRNRLEHLDRSVVANLGASDDFSVRDGGPLPDSGSPRALRVNKYSVASRQHR